jgi:phage gp29-like protein
MWRLCDLLEDQRTRDCHLQTVCSRRERSLANLPWQIIPASDRPRDLRVAAWLEDVLKAFGGERIDGQDLRSLPETVTHLNAGAIHGYGAAEVLWRRDGRYVVPSGAIPMQPRRFIYSQADASLRWYDMSGGPPGIYYPGKDLLADYPAGRFLVHRPRTNGAVGSREGLIRPLVWASLFRTWDIGDLMKLAELAWKPYRLGSYNNEAGDEDINDLELALEMLTTSGWAVHNKDRTEIDIAYAKNRSAGDGGLHIALANFLAAEMSKVTLGATLTVEQGRIGSNALGNVHQDVSVEVRDADARGDESTIQRQLCAPLVHYNFGDVPVPTFRYITEQGADMLALTTMVDKLGSVLDLPAKWVRAELGAPEPDVGEELVGGRFRADPNAPKPEPVAPMAEQPAPPQQDPKAPQEPQAPTDNEGPQVTEKAMHRMLRVYRVDTVMREMGIRRPAMHEQTRIAA